MTHSSLYDAMRAGAGALLADGAILTPEKSGHVDLLFRALDDLDDAKFRNAAREDRRAARTAFAKRLHGQNAALSSDERRLLDGGNSSILNIAEGAPGTGGYLVPQLVLPEYVDRLKFYSAIASVARSISTDFGAPLSLPTVDDTTNVGSLLSESTLAPSNDINFGVATFGGYKFTSGIVPVSFEIMQDSTVDVTGMILDLFAKRIGRGQNAFFTTGTGTGQPQGALIGASLGVTLPTGNTTSVTYAGLVSLYQSLDPAYRSSPRCAWMMNDNTLLAIKELQDGGGQRPLFLPDVIPQPPGSPFHGFLMGKPVIVNPDMPGMAANATPVLFGDFEQYAIRQVRGLAVIPMNDSAYAKKGQQAFVAFGRADGRVLIPQALKYLQNSAS